MFIFRLAWLCLLILFSLAASAFSALLSMPGCISGLVFKWRADLDVRTVERAGDRPPIGVGSNRKH